MRRGELELTARGRVTLVLVFMAASTAVTTAAPFAQLATAVLGALFTVDLGAKLLDRPRLSVAVQRRRTRAGAVFRETITVGNLRARGHAHGIEIAEPASGVRGGAAWIETLPAGASVGIELPARVRRRGVAMERRFVATALHPFGMLRWRATVACAVRLVAEPARVALAPRVVERIREREREPRAAWAAAGSEFFALREYRAGEDARRVHARRSARTGALVTRDVRGGGATTAAIVVDLRRPPGRLWHFGDRELEHRLGLAAALFDELLAAGMEPECAVVGQGVQRWRADSPAAAERFLDALAVARPVAHFRLEPALLDAFRGAVTAYWIPAGGHDGRRERERLGDVVVIGEVVR